MSDLSATNCGCGSNGSSNCSSIIWLIILFSIFGNGCNTGCGGNGFGNNSYDTLLLLIILISCGGGGLGIGCGCGCGCN